MQGPLNNTIIPDIKAGLKPLTDHATIYYKAWQQCEDAKLNYIRDFGTSSLLDLDTTYSSYTSKQHELTAAIPQDFNSYFDAIQKANDKLTVITVQEIADGTKSLLTAVSSIYQQYQKLHPGS